MSGFFTPNELWRINTHTHARDVTSLSSILLTARLPNKPFRAPKQPEILG